ncbi:MAG TPA: 50S ribosomal protein L3 N(5)-glutamine methyltransferase, partial [Motiliproteus sp.]
MSQRDPALDQLHSIRDFIRLGVSRFRRAELFFGHGTDNAWDEAVQLVLHAAGLPWNADSSLLDARLLEQEKIAVLELFRQRIQERVPAPYLIGEAWFCELPFYVDRRTLIPRSPIADLIRNGFEPWLEAPVVERVLDLCTGSGCIGIACAQLFDEAEVDLVDLSSDALEVCERNIQRHRLGDRVHAINSDLFAALDGRRYQLIVSNPPYVDANDYRSMPAEYQHEPVLGLTSGDDGLDITR